VSFVAQLAATASRVLAIESPGGTLHVRIRRPTAGDSITSGALGLAQPRPTEEEAAVQGTIAKRRASMRSQSATEALYLATFQTQCKIVAACVTHVGPSPDALEPVTIQVYESDPIREGSEGLPIGSLLPDWIGGIASALWDMEGPGGWTALTAAAFPGRAPGGVGGDGAGVGSAP